MKVGICFTKKLGRIYDSGIPIGGFSLYHIWQRGDSWEEVGITLKICKNEFFSES